MTNENLKLFCLILLTVLFFPLSLLVWLIYWLMKKK